MSIVVSSILFFAKYRVWVRNTNTLLSRCYKLNTVRELLTCINNWFTMTGWLAEWLTVLAVLVVNETILWLIFGFIFIWMVFNFSLFCAFAHLTFPRFICEYLHPYFLLICCITLAVFVYRKCRESWKLYFIGKEDYINQVINVRKLMEMCVVCS